MNHRTVHEKLISEICEYAAGTPALLNGKLYNLQHIVYIRHLLYMMPDIAAVVEDVAAFLLIKLFPSLLFLIFAASPPLPPRLGQG